MSVYVHRYVHVSVCIYSCCNKYVCTYVLHIRMPIYLLYMCLHVLSLYHTEGDDTGNTRVM